MVGRERIELPMSRRIRVYSATWAASTQQPADEMVANLGVQPSPSRFQRDARQHESLKAIKVGKVGVEPTMLVCPAGLAETAELQDRVVFTTIF